MRVSNPFRTSADAEQRARVDLAACYRLADRFGLNEGIDNHLTLLVPGTSDRFLLRAVRHALVGGEGQRFHGGGFRAARW